MSKKKAAQQRFCEWALNSLEPGLGLWQDRRFGWRPWVSGKIAAKKVPAIFDFAGTFFYTWLSEAHSGPFYRTIWLDAGTFVNKILYRPANKLTESPIDTSGLPTYDEIIDTLHGGTNRWNRII